MLINDFLNKDPEIVPEEAPPIILDSKSYSCMANNGEDTMHKKYIYRRVHVVGEWWNLQNAQDLLVWRRSTIGRYCN